MGLVGLVCIREDGELSDDQFGQGEVVWFGSWSVEDQMFQFYVGLFGLGPLDVAFFTGASHCLGKCMCWVGGYVVLHMENGFVKQDMEINNSFI